MKVTYDSQEDTLRILLCNAPIQNSVTHPSGLILDYDQQGRIVGLELAAASEHMSRPDIMGRVEETLLWDDTITAPKEP